MPALDGKRIVVTRANQQADELNQRLLAHGAIVINCPTIQIAPPENPQPLIQALQAIDQFDWLICTSANSVHACIEWLTKPLPARLKIATVGQATARALKQYDQNPDLLPSIQTSSGLLAELPDLAGQRILLPQADIAPPDLAEALQASGADVVRVIAYQTIPGDGIAHFAPILRQQAYDVILFTSPSTILYLIEGLGQHGFSASETIQLLNQQYSISIGPTTSSAAAQRGLQIAAEAEPHTNAGLVEAVVRILDFRF